VNDLSFRQLLDWGAERITLGWDYSLTLRALDVPASRIEWIVSGRVPLFTTEHCLWKANLVAPGKPCGKLCKVRPLKIRDRRGAIHSVRSDLFCRNIIESSELIDVGNPGVWHVRVENPIVGFVKEDI
jgi:hypothetical protein